MLRVSGVPVSNVKLFALFVCGVILLSGAIDASGLVELKEVPVVIDKFCLDLITSFNDVISVGYVGGSLRSEEYSFSKELRG